jgi:NAD(P)-dependent dehydrogenase (short-subunit alcohol dehydrogenase family)
VARCLEEVGPLDAIVNNAGISGGGPVEVAGDTLTVALDSMGTA